MFSKGLVTFISLLLLLFIMLLYYMNMKTEQKYPLTDNDPYNASQCIQNYLLNYSDKSQTQQLIYNRVPKCGSHTMRLAIANLGNILNYHVTLVQFRRMTYWIDSANERDKIREAISTLPKPWIYIRHMYFLDFNTSSTVYYVNLIRDPVQRLVSWFYYIRQKYRIERYGNPPDERTLTFNECVQKNYSECQQPYIFQIIPFFCGHNARCTTPSKWALEKAKQNVENNFPVLGYLENMTQFFDVVEHVWPQFFRNVKTIYSDIIKREGAHKTHGKVLPSKSSIAIMRKRLHFEYEFYYYVKERFDCLYSRLFSA